MAKSPKRIWCPKCHKRHGLPPNAGGMTLRCRGCKFAFRVQDGLTQDPNVAAVPAMPDQDSRLDSPASMLDQHHPDLHETMPSMPVESAPQTEQLDLQESNPSFSFDDNYDDILDVLDTPDSDPLAAPTRAIATTGAPPRSVAPQGSRAVAVAEEPATPREPVTRQQLRSHRNSRQFWMLMTFLFSCLLGLTSWVGVKLLMAPGLSGWERRMLYAMGSPARFLPPQVDEEEALLPTNHVKLRGDHFELADRSDVFQDEFFEPDDSEEEPAARNFGERRWQGEDDEPEQDQPGAMAQGQGVRNQNRQPNRQANRNLPDQNDPRRNVAPQQRVQPRQQAQRQQAQRQQQVQRPDGREDPEDGFGNLPLAKPGPGQGQAARNQPRVQPRVQPRARQQQFAPGPDAVAPEGGFGALPLAKPPRPNQAKAGNRQPDRVARNRRNVAPPPRNNAPRGRNSRPSRSAFQPPNLERSDVQLAAARGIDPKSLRSLTVDVDARTPIALSGEMVFSIGNNNRLTVLDSATHSVVENRKLDREPAAICAAAPNEISNRPAAWILYNNGQLEKWEIANGELNQLVTISVKPVFNERTPQVAAGAKNVAYVHAGKIFLSEVLEAAEKLGVTKTVVAEGDVRALRFSVDGRLLAAVVNKRVKLIDVAQGKIIADHEIPGIGAKAVNESPVALSLSADLKNLFFCSGGIIHSFGIEEGQANGLYWASQPFAFRGAVSAGNTLIGLAGDPSAYAEQFSIAEMELVGANGAVAKKAVAEADVARKELLAGGGEAFQDGGQAPHEISRSPLLAAPIESLQMLPNNRIAFLTMEDDSRIAVATWKDGWQVTSLKIDAGFKINGFAMSEDLSKVAIYSNDVVQAWEIVDIQTGAAEFVSESVAHTNRVTHMILTKDGERIVSGDLSGGVHAANFATGKRTGGVFGFKTRIANLVAKGDGAFVAMDQQGTAKGNGNATRDKIDRFDVSVTGASALSAGGNKIAFFVGGSNEVKVGNVGSQKITDQVKVQQRPDFIRFSKDSKYLLLQTGREVSVWDWNKPERVRVFRYSAKVSRARVKHDIADDGQTVAVVTGKKFNQISIFEMPGVNKPDRK